MRLHVRTKSRQRVILYRDQTEGNYVCSDRLKPCSLRLSAPVSNNSVLMTSIRVRLARRSSSITIPICQL